jgi:hypothetical protein
MKDKKVDKEENKTLSVSIPESLIFALKKEALIQSRKKGRHISVSSLIVKSLNNFFKEEEE